ncbi:hypothetical protein OH77DRAFT_701599 [Trametes cingulata]|nr:hypothetical protein OH77DRAFT_701599 [Trametes cingulata]
MPAWPQSTSGRSTPSNSEGSIYDYQDYQGFLPSAEYPNFNMALGTQDGAPSPYATGTASNEPFLNHPYDAGHVPAARVDTPWGGGQAYFGPTVSYTEAPAQPMQKSSFTRLTAPHTREGHAAWSTHHHSRNAPSPYMRRATPVNAPAAPRRTASTLADGLGQRGAVGVTRATAHASPTTIAGSAATYNPYHQQALHLPSVIPPTYAAPSSSAHTTQTTLCAWDGCGLHVGDDVCAPGLIKKHLRECHFHGNTPSAKDRVACKWGGNCTREPMQWENIPKHIAECHVKSMTRYCLDCGGNFARPDTLKRHKDSGGCPKTLRRT